MSDLIVWAQGNEKPHQGAGKVCYQKSNLGAAETPLYTGPPQRTNDVGLLRRNTEQVEVHQVGQEYQPGGEIQLPAACQSGALTLFWLNLPDTLRHSALRPPKSARHQRGAW